MVDTFIKLLRSLQLDPKANQLSPNKW